VVVVVVGREVKGLEREKGHLLHREHMELIVSTVGVSVVVVVVSRVKVKLKCVERIINLCRKKRMM